MIIIVRFKWWFRIHPTQWETARWSTTGCKLSLRRASSAMPSLSQSTKIRWDISHRSNRRRPINDGRSTNADGRSRIYTFPRYEDGEVCKARLETEDALCIRKSGSPATATSRKRLQRLHSTACCRVYLVERSRDRAWPICETIMADDRENIEGLHMAEAGAPSQLLRRNGEHSYQIDFSLKRFALSDLHTRNKKLTRRWGTRKQNINRNKRIENSEMSPMSTSRFW